MSSLANVSSEWVDGNLYWYDKSKNVIAYWDGANRALVIPSGSTLTIGATSIGPTNPAAANGAITAVWGNVPITKTSAAALTIADPTSGDDDGKRLLIFSTTAYAHTIDNSAGSGFNVGGTASDVATLGGGIGDGLELVAYLGKWYVVGSTNVAFG